MVKKIDHVDEMAALDRGCEIRRYFVDRRLTFSHSCSQTAGSMVTFAFKSFHYSRK